LEIQGNKRTYTHRLIIPRKLLESEARVSSRAAQPNDEDRSRTIIAGIAMSLAAVSCVFLFLRNRSANTKVATCSILVAGILFAAGELATADLPPPAADVVREWKSVGEHDVEIEISEKGDNVVLILGTRYSRRSQPDRERPEAPVQPN
jgi:hypothetical protein